MYASLENSHDLFVKAQLIRKHFDYLSRIKYCDSSSHLPDNELFLGDSTAALSVYLSENDGERLKGSSAILS